MAVTIKQVLDEELKDLKIDAELCKRIIQFNLRLMNIDANHSAFFGGVLIGVNPIRFHDTDLELWYQDVLGVDPDVIAHNFKKVTAIDPSHMVASNVFNHLPGYLTYRLNQVSSIPAGTKREAQIALFMIMHIRFLTSLLGPPRFKFPAKKSVAEATFMSLTYKFDIKNYGSWRELLRARSEDILEPDSIYRNVLHGFKDEHMAIRLITDKQTLIRKLINKYYGVYMEVIAAGGRVITTSEMFESAEGEMVVRDKNGGYGSYITHMNALIPKPKDFIRSELQAIIEQAVEQMQPHLLDKTLEYMSKNYAQPRMKHLEQFVEESMLYCFEYMQSVKTSQANNKDLIGIVTNVRGKIMAPRTEDIRVLTIREEGEAIVREATGTRTPSYLASTRTGLMLYLVLRALTRNYYD